MRGAPDIKNWEALCLLAVAVFLFLYNRPVFALGEQFSLYDSPQALMMGNAVTADSRWYTALFQNPAGLAQAYRRDTRRHWAVTPVAIDWIPSAATLGQVLSEKTMQFARTLALMQSSPGGYQYSRLNLVPSVTHRNFGVAALITSEFAAKSDGTNVDIRAGNDVAMVAGVASNFFGNILKVGVNVKAILRNQIEGTFAHSALPDTASIASNMREGMGFGADAGILLTAPLLWLPTFGLVVKDITGTRFTPSRILNQSNNGLAPSEIRQSINAGFMMSPILFRGIRANLTADLKYLDRPDIAFAKRVHFGAEIITEKRLYVWLGMNQLILPCFGLGLRTVGGDLEVGTFAQDVGDGETREANRRFSFRYTIGW
jgi:hypothetical protein